jgi:hypothetical protein
LAGRHDSDEHKIHLIEGWIPENIDLTIFKEIDNVKLA